MDDASFARAWVENRERHRPRSALMLRSELRQRGVSASVAAEALEGLDAEASALNAARRYARRLAGLSERDFEAKLTGHLQRRGFSRGVALTASRALWAEEEAGLDDDDGGGEG